MATQASINYAQKMYMAFYQRIAEPAGLAYWAGQIDAAGGVPNDTIIDGFANSAEATALLAGQSVESVLTMTYLNLFQRNPDAAGLSYYEGQIASGATTLGRAVLDIANGATGTDLIGMNLRIGVANDETNQIGANPTWTSQFTIKLGQYLLNNITAAGVTGPGTGYTDPTIGAGVTEELEVAYAELAAGEI
jgi:hypothetical protein